MNGAEQIEWLDLPDFKAMGEHKDATFSPCRTWRYQLRRRWSLGPWCNFLMLNPSTADETVNDPTVTRAERFARRWAYGGLIVTNLFAFRATDPQVMRAAADPVGPENDAAILAAAKASGLVLCAWGNHGGFLRRGEQVRRLLEAEGVALHVLMLTGMRQPVHPLYQPNSRRPIPWPAE